MRRGHSVATAEHSIQGSWHCVMFLVLVFDNSKLHVNAIATLANWLGLKNWDGRADGSQRTISTAEGCFEVIRQARGFEYPLNVSVLKEV